MFTTDMMSSRGGRAAMVFATTATMLVSPVTVSVSAAHQRWHRLATADLRSAHEQRPGRRALEYLAADEVFDVQPGTVVFVLAA